MTTCYCPNCHAKLQIPDDGPAEQRPCPCCGSAILSVSPDKLGEEYSLGPRDLPPPESRSIDFLKRTGETVTVDDENDEARFNLTVNEKWGMAPLPRKRMSVDPSVFELMNSYFDRRGISWWVILTLIQFAFFFGLISASELFLSELSRKHVFLVFSFLFGFVLMLVTWVLSATILQQIQYDASEGSPVFDSALDFSVVDSFYQSFYLLLPLIVPVAIMTILGHIPGMPFIAVAGMGLVLIYLIYPISLLSMQEQQSPFYYISRNVIRSIKGRPVTWLNFYIASFVLLFSNFAIFALIVWAIKLPNFIMLVYLPVFSLSTIVYFRLLGRLVWVSGRAKKFHPEDQSHLKNPPICRPPVREI